VWCCWIIICLIWVACFCFCGVLHFFGSVWVLFVYVCGVFVSASICIDSAWFRVPWVHQRCVIWVYYGIIGIILGGTTFVGHVFSASATETRVERTEWARIFLASAAGRRKMCGKCGERRGAVFPRRKESWLIERRTQSALNVAAGS